MQIRALTDDETLARDAGLNMAADIIGAPRPLTLAHVQTLYNARLAEAATDDALISLGLAFGEQIILAAPNFEWARVTTVRRDLCCRAREKHLLRAN